MTDVQKKLSRSFKFKIRPQSKRGSCDPNAVIEALQQNWDDFQQQLSQVSDEESEEIKQYFNELLEDDNELGDKLFHDEYDGPGNLGQALVDLGPACVKKFTEALVETDCIDREFLIETN